MVLETLFPVNEGMNSIFTQASILLPLIIFSIVKISILFSILVTLTSPNLKEKNRKALFVASGTEGLNFILKSLIVLNFLNLAARLEESTGIGVNKIIIVPTILSMLFSISLIRKTYETRGEEAVFWYVWLISGVLILLLSDIALVLLLTT